MGNLLPNTLSPKDIAEIRDIEENSLLDIAIMSRRTQLLKDLVLRAGIALSNETLNRALRSAVVCGDVELVQHLYRLADAIYHDKYDGDDEYGRHSRQLGRLALVEASKQGLEDMIPILLVCNKSLYLEDALMDAWVHGHLNVVDMLIEAGAEEHRNPDFTIDVIMKSYELRGNSIDEDTRTKLINHLVYRGAATLEIVDEEEHEHDHDTDDYWYYYKIGYYGTESLARYFIAHGDVHTERHIHRAIVGTVVGNNVGTFMFFLELAQSRGCALEVPRLAYLALRGCDKVIVERLFADYAVELSSPGPNMYSRDERLLFAARSGSITTLSMFLRFPNQNVNCIASVTSKPSSKACTALSRASDPDTIRFLLEAKADVNPEGCDTVLRGACEKLRPDAVKALLAAGADVNRVGSYEGAMSALYYAVYAECAKDRVRDKIEVINMLIDAGANTRNCGEGKSVLHPGELPECWSYNLDTAFAAVLARDPELVHCRDASGATPLLQLLRQHKEPAPVKVLLDAKADVNATDKHGNSALSQLVTVQRYDKPDGMNIRRIVRMLVDAGADFTQTSQGAMTETQLMSLVRPTEVRGWNFISDGHLESGRLVGDAVLQDVIEAILHPPAAMGDD
jgi:ankyrin repeat protein